MSGDTILIKFDELLQNADEIQKLNLDLRDTLDEIEKTVINLENVWESESSNSIRQKMKAMDKHFSQYEQVVTAYTKFLKDVVTTYQTVEKSINSTANSFS